MQQLLESLPTTSSAAPDSSQRGRKRKGRPPKRKPTVEPAATEEAFPELPGIFNTEEPSQNTEALKADPPTVEPPTPAQAIKQQIEEEPLDAAQILDSLSQELCDDRLKDLENAKSLKCSVVKEEKDIPAGESDIVKNVDSSITDQTENQLSAISEPLNVPNSEPLNIPNTINKSTEDSTENRTDAGTTSPVTGPLQVMKIKFDEDPTTTTTSECDKTEDPPDLLQENIDGTVDLCFSTISDKTTTSSVVEETDKPVEPPQRVLKPLFGSWLPLRSSRKQPTETANLTNQCEIFTAELKTSDPATADSVSPTIYPTERIDPLSSVPDDLTLNELPEFSRNFPDDMEISDEELEQVIIYYVN